MFYLKTFKIIDMAIITFLLYIVKYIDFIVSINKSYIKEVFTLWQL
ncbi:hypothetical protein FTW_1310 [Francisella tularensis subsp. tularensis WY96-3418]|nr:hypothetical protein FTW_1310 [Francisella tularensis subsp. tularensis WY96-3418]ABU60871.1 hypothetical protein FTA_0394 [Francisella tularensis subsp. holarctica FTNF002-00]ADA78553.1 hypothetical protein NE061598_05000 [Francisella tularensis subsp. tularensis NE061598]